MASVTFSVFYETMFHFHIVTCNGHWEEPAKYKKRMQSFPFSVTYCGHVYWGSGLIHDQNTAFAHKRSCQAEQLPLSLTEILPTFRYHGV